MIILSCAGDRALLLHNAEDLLPKKAYLLSASPDAICRYGDKLIVCMNISGEAAIYSLKNGGLIKKLPRISEPSGAVLLDLL